MRRAAIAVVISLAGAVMVPGVASAVPLTVPGGPNIVVAGVIMNDELKHLEGRTATYECLPGDTAVVYCDARIGMDFFASGSTLDDQFGQRTLTVHARDAAGKEASETIHFFVWPDLAKPNTTQLTKLKASHSGSTVTAKVIEKSKHSAKGKATFSIYKGKTRLKTLTAKVSGKNVAKIRLPDLRAGKYRVVVVYLGNTYLQSSTTTVTVRVR